MLAADAALNPKVDSLEALKVNADVGPSLLDTKAGLQFGAQAKGPWSENEMRVGLVPFADAGSSGAGYRIWLRTGG